MTKPAKGSKKTVSTSPSIAVGEPEVDAVELAKREFHLSVPYPVLREALKTDSYVALIRTCRQLNGLMFIFYALRRNDQSDRSAQGELSRYSGAFLLGAALAETIRRIEGLRTHYRNDEAFSGIARLLKDKTSHAIYPYLTRVRNEVGFHSAEDYATNGSSFLEQNGVVGDEPQEVVLEYNTGWDFSAHYYEAADILGLAHTLYEGLPSYEQLQEFGQRFDVPLPPLPEPESGVNSLIRRSVFSTTLTTTVVIAVVQKLALSVHRSMGAELKVGRPSGKREMTTSKVRRTRRGAQAKQETSSEKGPPEG